MKLMKYLLCAFIMLTCIAPSVLAEEDENYTIDEVIIYQSNLSRDEIEESLIKQIDLEVQSLTSKHDENGLLRARPTYETVYGTTQRVDYTGKCGNQNLPGGRQFPTGGGFYFSDQGGPTLSVSVGFPAPYNLIGFSVSFGNSSTSGIFVNAPNKVDYFLLYSKMTYDVKPYVVYETDSFGNKKVYSRNVVKTLYRSSAYAQKV
ncbi:hypothetical protein [Anaerorhabdus sp.]|uniref:hypothetical protein n=1 Tax=Anaerorhabdus sp. TaxID=1872524 RepID=UPI002FC5FD30